MMVVLFSYYNVKFKLNLLISLCITFTYILGTPFTLLQYSLKLLGSLRQAVGDGQTGSPSLFRVEPFCNVMCSCLHFFHRSRDHADIMKRLEPFPVVSCGSYFF